MLQMIIGTWFRTFACCNGTRFEARKKMFVYYHGGMSQRSLLSLDAKFSARKNNKQIFICHGQFQPTFKSAASCNSTIELSTLLKAIRYLNVSIKAYEYCIQLFIEKPHLILNSKNYDIKLGLRYHALT